MSKDFDKALQHGIRIRGGIVQFDYNKWHVVLEINGVRYYGKKKHDSASDAQREYREDIRPQLMTVIDTMEANGQEIIRILQPHMEVQ